MLTDPITLTLNGVSKSLARILIDGSKAVYQTNDEELTLTVSHQRSNGRTRSMLRIDRRKAATDLVAFPQGFVVLTDYHVMDRPDSTTSGFTLAEVEQLVACRQAYETNTIVDKLFGREI